MNTVQRIAKIVVVLIRIRGSIRNRWIACSRISGAETKRRVSKTQMKGAIPSTIFYFLIFRVAGAF